MSAAAPIAELESVRRQRGSGADSFRLEVERFVIRPGERIAVVGPSGSGKSTFLDLMSLSLAPESAGRFRLGPAGEDVAALWRARDAKGLARLRRLVIGYVLQSGALLPFLTASQNVELPLRLAGEGPRERRAQAGALLARLALEGCARRLPSELSIGQRQRVAVARALVQRPRIVLADETTASLDGGAAAAVMALMVELAEERGAAVLLVTHDERLPSRYGFSAVPCQPLQREAGNRSTIRRDP